MQKRVSSHMISINPGHKTTGALSCKNSLNGIPASSSMVSQSHVKNWHMGAAIGAGLSALASATAAFFGI